MEIISKIEINYFRSIYSLTLSPNNDINILIGGNDTGKSNLLKSLNLFFNNQTELQFPFNFNDDLSRPREKQARSAKGRAVIWIKVTFNNFLKWSSLPKQFSVKRTWNRYSDQPVDSYPQTISNSTIARYLNKISFHYIPAVRGRDIFTHFLNLLHDALIDDEKAGVREASNSLMSTINESTDDMSRRIKQGLGFNSNIQVPKDLRDLFAALDFSTKFSGYDIPLQKRGDGIQARHIPFILDFIGRHSKKSHIWAYEEPENSLELGKAFELAKQFNEEFSKDNQIYITTHSPAFYDLSGENVTKWFLEPGNFQGSEEIVTKIKRISEGELADESMGVAALISSRAKELYNEINELKQTEQLLNERVLASTLPQIIVEGPTDKKILETAFSKLFPDDETFCEFIPAKGCSHITSYVKSSDKLTKNIEVPIIGLFDNDSAGRKEIKKFKSYKKVENNGFRIINHSKQIFCGILPLPNDLKEIIKEANRLVGSDTDFPIAIEFMFPKDVISRAVSENILVLKDRMATAQDSELSTKVNLTKIFSEKLPTEYNYLSKEIDDDSKNAFSEWVGNLTREDFRYFKETFSILKGLIVTADTQPTASADSVPSPQS